MMPGVPVAIERRRRQSAVFLPDMPVGLPLAADSMAHSAIRGEQLPTCRSILHGGGTAGCRDVSAGRRRTRCQQDRGEYQRGNDGATACSPDTGGAHVSIFCQDFSCGRSIPFAVVNPSPFGHNLSRFSRPPQPQRAGHHRRRTDSHGLWHSGVTVGHGPYNVRDLCTEAVHHFRGMSTSTGRPSGPFQSRPARGRTCAIPHLDSRLRGNDDIRFSGQ